MGGESLIRGLRLALAGAADAAAARPVLLGYQVRLPRQPDSGLVSLSHVRRNPHTGGRKP